MGKCQACDDGWIGATDIYMDGSYATGRGCPRCRGTGNDPNICDECELPKTSEAHRQHCPEAIRG